MHLVIFSLLLRLQNQFFFPARCVFWQSALVLRRFCDDISSKNHHLVSAWGECTHYFTSYGTNRPLEKKKHESCGLHLWWRIRSTIVICLYADSSFKNNNNNNKNNIVIINKIYDIDRKRTQHPGNINIFSLFDLFYPINTIYIFLFSHPFYASSSWLHWEAITVQKDTISKQWETEVYVHGYFTNNTRRLYQRWSVFIMERLDDRLLWYANMTPQEYRHLWGTLSFWL